MAENEEKAAPKRARRSSRRAADTGGDSGGSGGGSASPRAEGKAGVAAGPSVGLSDIRLPGMGVRYKDVNVFLRQLIMLLEAGTPILKSLQTLAHRSERAAVRAMVSDIAQFVEMGNPLWRAFERYREFDTVFVNLVRASEASGTLITVLKQLVEHRERTYILRKRIKASMLYPVILIIACFGVVVVISKVLIPNFKELFSRMDVPLPEFTQRFMAATDWLAAYWAHIIIALAVIFAAIKIVVWQSRWVKYHVDRWKLKIPVMGPIWKQEAIIRFTRSLSLLMKSGLSMMVTLDLVRRSIGNEAYARMTQEIADEVEKGESVEKPLRRNRGLMPGVVTDMLVTGQESGSMDAVAEQISQSYEEEMNIRVNALADLLVPLITVFIAVVVGMLAFALFKPMLAMLEALNSGSMGGGGGI